MPHRLAVHMAQVAGGALSEGALAGTVERRRSTRRQTMSDLSVLLNRTKIVATIGPASWSRPVLRQLIDAGVNVFRLNFSHGTHNEHSAILADIRALSRDMDRHVAILQ